MTARNATIISLIGPPGSGKGTYGALLASRIPSPSVLAQSFFNATFLSVGDILRECAKQNRTIGGKAVKDVLLEGNLVDDEFVGHAVLDHLESSVIPKPGDVATDGDSNPRNTIQTTSPNALNRSMIILDGFPRNHAQTTHLSKWPKNLKPSFAIQFDVPDCICITKLLGRRKCSICGGNFNINGVDTDGFFMPPILPTSSNSHEQLCKSKCDWDVDWEKRDDDTAETIQKRMQVYHEQTEPVLNYWSERDELLRFVPYKGVLDMDKLEELVLERIK